MRFVRARFSIPALVGVVAVLALVPPAAQSEAPVMHHAAMEDLGEPPKTHVAKPSLPPRALLRIGTNDLRTRDSIMALAFSPDGRLIAAADANAPSPRVTLFDVRTGQRVKQIVAPGNQRGWVASVAFSPDGTKLLWGEMSGDVALLMRFNALTGHEQRRFLAEWRTPEQQKAGRPSAPGMMSAAFSGDGRTVVSSAEEWDYVWDVESGTMRRKFHNPYQHGCYVALAPDGRMLAMSDAWYGEDAIRLYDTGGLRTDHTGA
jgi:WD40 repeat protein